VDLDRSRLAEAETQALRICLAAGVEVGDDRHSITLEDVQRSFERGLARLGSEPNGSRVYEDVFCFSLLPDAGVQIDVQIPLAVVHQG
jgi:hypothetical protein